MAPPAIPTVPLPRPLPAAAAPAVGVVRRLAAAGHQAYLVGGAVRDLMLDREPGDFDVATSASPEQILALFPLARQAGAAFPVVLVHRAGESSWRRRPSASRDRTATRATPTPST